MANLGDLVAAWRKRTTWWQRRRIGRQAGNGHERVLARFVEAWREWLAALATDDSAAVRLAAVLAALWWVFRS